MTDTVSFMTYCGSKDNRVVPVKTARTIGARECLVEITHSGYCATDTYFTGVPMGLGHEGVGIIRQLGPAVTQHKVYVLVPHSAAGAPLVAPPS